MFNSVWEFSWIDLLDIAVLAVLFYYLFLIIRGTKGVQLLKGLIIIFLAMFLSRILGLRGLNWFLEKVLAFGALAILIIFQPEFRNALVRLGETGFMGEVSGLSSEKIHRIVTAVFRLAQERKGALIAIERKVGLADYLPSGKLVEADISEELLLTIFHPGSPLHDGAAIIAQNKIAGAGCLLPLSERTDIDPALGTRHRAALGLSEQTDSLVIVVSEEKGVVSLAKDGQFIFYLTPERLTKILSDAFMIRRKKHNEKRKFTTVSGSHQK